MVSCDLPLTEAEKKADPTTIGIVCHSAEDLRAALPGFSELPLSRSFLPGEMQFWPLPETSSYWRVYKR